MSFLLEFMNKYMRQTAPLRHGRKVVIPLALLGLLAAGGAPAWADDLKDLEGTGSTDKTATVGNDATYENVYGGKDADNGTSGYTVNMTGGTVTKSVYGGYSNTGNATGNTVTISGGTVGTVDELGTFTGNVYGGGSYSNTGNATVSDNTVEISGSAIINGNVYGGYAKGGYGTDNSVTGNTVTIRGGTIKGNVYGGFLETTADGSGITNNTVNIYGSPTFAATTALYGANVSGGTNNTLNLYTSGIEVSTIHHFNNLNFYLPANVTPKTTILTLLGNASTPTNVNLEDVQIGVGIQGGGTPLQTGDTVVLIDGSNLTANNNSLLTDDTLTNNTSGMQGISLLYDFALNRDGDKILATATYKGVNQQTQDLQSGQASALVLSLQGADLSAGAGMSNALAATGGLNNAGGAGGMGGSASSGGGQSGGLGGSTVSTGGAQAGGAASSHGGQAGGTQAGGAASEDQQASGLGGSADGSRGIVPFYAVSGGSLRYDAGADIDVTGYSMLAGMAKSLPLDSVNLLLGAFFETGGARYHSSSEYSGAASVDGEGSSRYYGGGLLARLDVTEGLLRGLYVEGSARAGTLTASYESSDLKDATGRTAAYDVQSPYHSLHAGLGYLWRINDSLTLDVSSKYFYSHVAGDSVRVIDDPVDFEDTHSYRWRNGLRLTYAASETFAPYAGVAYEHEYGGESRAAVYGKEMPSASVEGGTGIGELGFTLRPVADSTFAVDLGLQGYTGKRQGVTGGLQLSWEF